MADIVRLINENPSLAIAVALATGAVGSWLAIQRMVVKPLWQMNHNLITRIDAASGQTQQLVTALNALAETVQHLAGIDQALQIMAAERQRERRN